MKKLLFITPYFFPALSYGGPPKVLYLLAKELVKLGFEVTVITSDSLGVKRSLVNFEIIDKIKIYRYRTIANFLAYRYKIFYIHNLSVKISRFIKNSDFVLFSDLRTFLNWQIFPQLFKKKTPYGIFSFGQIPYTAGFKAVVKMIFDKLWVRDFVASASFRFCQTQHEQQMYRKYFGIALKKTQLLSLPVEINKNKYYRENMIEFRKKYDLKDEDKVILFIGRLHYLKGIDLLIKAITPLLLKDRTIKLLVVGTDEGEQAKLIKLSGSLYQKQIIFTGPIYQQELAALYRLSTCFVITPRFYEETSTAALEAMSFGKPVITTKQAQIPFLEKYQAGYIIDNEPVKIRKAVSKLLKEISIRQETLEKNALKLIGDYYRSDKVAQKLVNYLTYGTNNH